MQKVVIYLHGFLSSPQSEKARLTGEFVGQHYPQLAFEIPALANYPQAALDVAEQVIARYPGYEYRFIGSSLGGFLASCLQQKVGGKAVLINPAVKPYELLVDYLGEHVNPYSKQEFTLQHQHINELMAMDSPGIIQPQQFWVLLQTGDETLDYRQAEYKYQHSRLTIEPGGDHSFQGFARFLPDIFRFLLQD